MKHLLIIIVLSFGTLTSTAQAVLITSGLTSTGGNRTDDISFDYAVGQVLTSSFVDANIQGGEGILQVIPQSTVSTTASELLEVTLFPNPTIARVHINLPSSAGSVIRCYDTQGILHFEEAHKQATIDISLSNLPAGIYYLMVSQDRKSTSFKISKIE